MACNGVATCSAPTDSGSSTVKLNRLINVYVLLSSASAALLRSAALLPPFRSWSNATSLLGTSVPLMMAALGQLFAMIVWGVDLSIGSNMNVVITFGSYVLDAPLGMAVAGVVGCVLLGGLLRVVNGLLITRLKLPDFVVTLGTFISFQGIALTLRPTPGGVVNPDLLALAYGSTFFIPNTLLALIPIGAVLMVCAARNGSLHDRDRLQPRQLLSARPPGRPHSHLRLHTGRPMRRSAGVFLLGLIGTGSPTRRHRISLIQSLRRSSAEPVSTAAAERCWARYAAPSFSRWF
jgi:ribose transport system ATP-binding protein